MKNNLIITAHLLFALLIPYSTGLKAQIFKKRTSITEPQSESDKNDTTTGVIKAWRCLRSSEIPHPIISSNNYGLGQIHRSAFDSGYNGAQNRSVYACSSFGGL